MNDRVKKIDAPNRIIEFLYSANFGTAMLIATTLLEGFYAYKVYTITGKLTFDAITLIMAAASYTFVMIGIVVFFTLRKNNFIVYFVVFVELALNFMLEYVTVLQSDDKNKVVYFIAQLVIGILCPLATKSFADEISKKEVQKIMPTRTKNEPEIIENYSTEHKKKRTMTLNQLTLF